MARYYFDIVDGVKIKDPEGQEFDDTEGLEQEAKAAAREIIAEQARKGVDVTERRFEISDELGNTVLVLRFADALVSEERENGRDD